MSGWLEFELKDFRELGLDLLKNLPHFVGVLDQSINQSREQALYVEKLAGDTSRLWLIIIYFERGRVLSVKTHRRAATGNTRSQEASGTAGGSRSLGQQTRSPAHALAW
jgi:hypothetical protein